jgi:protein tyrosine phosphatase (PTP) superfamily phosphohydrolase (DUF442 family)
MDRFQTHKSLSPLGMRVRRRWRRRRLIAPLVGIVLALVALKEGDVLFGQNFHAVVSGELYRSAQLSPTALEGRINGEGIRAVVNLRGPNIGKPWYDDELAVCRRLSVAHVDVNLSARELPPPAEARSLMEALASLPRPILVHCKNGADRSGLASAAFLISAGDEGAERASGAQLNLWYGHMPVGVTTAMDRFFALFERTGAGKTLAVWVQQDYPRLYESERSGR